jgi:hypothetical protein
MSVWVILDNRFYKQNKCKTHYNLKPYFTNILGSDICMPLNKHLHLSSFNVTTDNLALLTDWHLRKIVPRLFFPLATPTTLRDFVTLIILGYLKFIELTELV